MNYDFKILPNSQLESIVPLVFELNEGKIEASVLSSRFNEIKNQNYECAIITLKNEIVGITGLWYCTRHYSGKSVEIDHVYIKPQHRNKGLGKSFMNWIQEYCKAKGYESLELNTYVQNHPSHKFYYNEGFKILGYHFLKKI
ncbi:MAG: GNAT family N-acetyltransferase [Winogradskyella sp.]|uniref:GNAT family N-acetyltransferase n=1 Tax=Winogradskyella poriferorum TaxID=307627 RepID=A0ABU7W0I0_9FLAO|nr:GNAT family N-acetyltransferase [Winogradskyella sp.]|tara:strand:+ start:217 stop:642 length:426 start_codon:yes stop_codon:yes gene_type:complete